jgi:hypothetical protein
MIEAAREFVGGGKTSKPSPSLWNAPSSARKIAIEEIERKGGDAGTL